MYSAFLDALPVLLSLYQSGFYQLFNAKAVLTYQDAWLEVKLPKEK